jgi:4-hydroxy-tetrahydrodipicolinate synthase
LPVLSVGGIGVISVLSNIYPKYTHNMIQDYFNGDVKEATRKQLHCLDLVDNLFSEVNPIPVKAATAKMGFGTNTLRLPLTPMNESKYEVMLNLMREQGLDV